MCFFVLTDTNMSHVHPNITNYFTLKCVGFCSYNTFVKSFLLPSLTFMPFLHLNHRVHSLAVFFSSHFGNKKYLIIYTSLKSHTVYRIQTQFLKSITQSHFITCLITPIVALNHHKHMHSKMRDTYTTIYSKIMLNSVTG